MSRKWFALAAAVGSVMFIAGISPAQDEKHSETHKLMEKISKKNNEIKKDVRTPANFEKAGAKKVAGKADDLIKLLQDARKQKESAEKQKKSYDDWTKLTDATITAVEDFRKVAEKGNQAEAKKAFTSSVGAKCSDCHKVFRVEDDE
ncbi:MAG TPA: cytochrome c [Isosphaeraceae bacterium]|jgi:cytochrome c556|nr:cytochrome c [Isosphaeraceae bacterium]